MTGALIAIVVITAVVCLPVWLFLARELADRKRNLPAEWAQEQRERQCR